ncbi:MAG: STAS domain-containing protein [Lentisphaerae bacterium]|nr:STAS domain-containing protein [Lentisphaerota bacterium]
MDIQTARQGKAVIVKPRGRMDAATAPLFEQACDNLVQAGEKAVVMDLSALEYISSAGLRTILSVGKKIKSASGKLALCSLAGMVKEVFDISGFTTMFVVTDSAEQAVNKVV